MIKAVTSAPAANVTPSGLPGTNRVRIQDNLIINKTNDNGTFTTKAISLENLFKTMQAQMTNAGNQFSGSFTGAMNGTNNGIFNGSGWGVTNVPGSPRSVFEFGVTGSGDDTAGFQAALNAGTNLFIPFGSYTTKQLNITNNTKLAGYGAKLTLLAGESNKVLLNFGSCTNVQVEGLELDGLDNRDITTRTPTTNRVAVQVYAYGQGNAVRALNIHGFDFGVTFTGDAGTLSSFGKPHAALSGIKCWTNYAGVSVVGGDSSHLVEYLSFSEMDCSSNAFGIMVDAGNISVRNSSFNANNINVAIGGAVPNSGHGIFSGCTISHSLFAGITATNQTTGYLFVGSQMLANPSFRFSGSSGVQFVGNVLGVSYIYGHTSHTNIFINNGYVGLVHFGSGPSGDLTFVDYATNYVHSGNYSRDTLGDQDYQQVEFLRTGDLKFNAAPFAPNAFFTPAAQGPANSLYSEGFLAYGSNDLQVLISVPDWIQTAKIEIPVQVVLTNTAWTNSVYSWYYVKNSDVRVVQTTLDTGIVITNSATNLVLSATFPATNAWKQVVLGFHTCSNANVARNFGSPFKLTYSGAYQ